MAEKRLGFRLHKNPLDSKGKAPYLGTIESTGVVGVDELMSRVARTMHTSAATARCCWDGMVEVLVEELKKGHGVETPFGLCEPAISGSMDTEDAPFNPARNKVYVKITPSRSFRKVLKGLVPVRLDRPVSDLSISALVSPTLGRRGYNTITADAPFTISGAGLGKGVKATLTDAKGAVHVLAVDLAKEISMVCRAVGPLVKGPAKLTLSAAGGEDGSVVFSDSRKVRVV